MTKQNINHVESNIRNGEYIAAKRLIDSVWTVRYSLKDDGTVRLISYSREDGEGYEREKEIPKAALIEEKGPRVVKMIRLIDHDDVVESFNVCNPANVFEYPLDAVTDLEWVCHMRSVYRKKADTLSRAQADHDRRLSLRLDTLLIKAGIKDA